MQDTQARTSVKECKRELNQYDKFTGNQFEQAIYHDLKDSSDFCKLTPASNDFGIDIILKNPDQTLGIQCKHTHGRAISNQAVEEAYAGGHYYNLDHSLVVTNGLFTPHAQKQASKLGVYLADRDALFQAILTGTLQHDNKRQVKAQQTFIRPKDSVSHPSDVSRSKKKHRKSVKVTTLNVDTDTLTKLSAAQHALGLKTHTDTLKFVIDKAIPYLIQSGVINKNQYDVVYKVFERMV